MTLWWHPNRCPRILARNLCGLDNDTSNIAWRYLPVLCLPTTHGHELGVPANADHPQNTPNTLGLLLSLLSSFLTKMFSFQSPAIHRSLESSSFNVTTIEGPIPTTMPVTIAISGLLCHLLTRNYFFIQQCSCYLCSVYILSPCELVSA